MRPLVSFLLATTTLSIPTAARADACEPARVMVVLDKSSSMVTGTIGDQTKWDIAKAGLDHVLGAYQNSAQFGLITFPAPNRCAPGAIDVQPAMGNRDAIIAALGTPPPAAGAWTPMAQTLEVAGSTPVLTTTSTTRHVILVTDGWQWCDPYDPATRFDGVDAVKALADQGVTAWIVGFGDEVDTAALNQMAVAAHTERPGCNVDNDDPAAPDNCYFQVDDAAQLVAALTAIAGSISDETCDGVDNDCDGQADEQLSRSCVTECGNAGVELCGSGLWETCAALDPDQETCNDPEPVDDTDDSAAYQAGCGCASGDQGPGAFAPFALLALLVLRRRRA